CLELAGAWEAIAEKVPLDAPWLAPEAAAWDATTLREWVAGTGVPDRVAGLFEVAVQAVFAATSAQLSLLHAAHYVHSAGGWSKLTDTEGGAQQDRLVGGVQPLAERLAARLPDGALRLSTPVRGLAQDGDGVTVRTAGGEVRARRAIVAVPPTLAGRIDHDPPLPPQRDQLLQHMPQGSVVKFHVIYDEPWWRAEGLSGTVLCPDEPIGVTFDGTPPAGTPGIVTGFFEGPAAVAAGARTREERRDVVVDVLARTLGERARDVRDYIDRDWSAEPWTRGCYGAHLPPGAWTVYGPALRVPVGRVHWAGTETAERWTGYIDGAIESGQRAAAEVLAARGSCRGPPGATPPASAAPAGCSSPSRAAARSTRSRCCGGSGAGPPASSPCRPPTCRSPTPGPPPCSAPSRPGCGGSSTGSTSTASPSATRRCGPSTTLGPSRRR